MGSSSMKVALGVSGGIAAYKAAEVVRLLEERGIRVQVIMTHAAQEFIRPLTFAALSGEKVITELFGAGAEQPNIDSAVEHMAVVAQMALQIDMVKNLLLASGKVGNIAPCGCRAVS